MSTTPPRDWKIPPPPGSAGDELKALRALNAELVEKVTNLTKLLDDQLGTPCEQIRHAEEKAELVEMLKRAEAFLLSYHGPEDYWIRDDIRAVLAKVE